MVAPVYAVLRTAWGQKHEEVGEILKANGFDPLRIDTVVMTHMHGDHAGGLPNFPNS